MKDTTRLNATLRSSIKAAIIHHRFAPEFKQLKAEGMDIAKVVYLRTFSLEEQMNLNAAPEGWFHEQSCIDLQIGDNKHAVKFGGDVYYRWDAIRNFSYRYFKDSDGKSTQRRMPHSYKWLKLNAHDPLAKRYHKLLQFQEGIEEAFKPAFSKINTMLGSYGTVGTLKAAWPEVEPFVPKAAAKVLAATPNLPAVSIPELNKALGLPV